MRHRSVAHMATAAGALALALVTALLVAFSSSSSAAVTFPECPPTTKTVTGNQSSATYDANSGGTWDLTGAVYEDPNAFPYPIRSENWNDGCILGGQVLGPIDPAATRDQWYNSGTHGGSDHEGVRITHTASDSTAVVRNTYVEDVEDAFDPNASSTGATTYLDGVHASHVRDDCIENEDLVHNLVLNNSLLDGCFTGFAFRPSGSTSQQNGTASSSFTVEDSLVYISPQPLGSGYCSDTSVTRGRCIDNGSNWLGAYGIWKWSDEAPANVTVRNTIFRLDITSYSSCRAQEWPAGTYENVTLVWTGQGAYADAGDCSNELPAGVTLTTDVSVWDQAKADWLAGGTEPTPEPPANTAPVADAGADATAEVGVAVQINGTVTDAEDTEGVQDIVWSVVSGDTQPYTKVDALDWNDATTRFTFSEAGTYVLRLTATDSGGLTGSDEVTVTVSGGTTPPPEPDPAAVQLVCPVVDSPTVGQTVTCVYE